MKNIFFALLLILQICNFSQAQELPTTRTIQPVKSTITQRGLGTAHVVFTTEKTFSTISSNNTKFYQGFVTIRNKTLPAAGMLHNQKLTITFPGRVHGSKQNRQRLYTIKKTKASIRISSLALSTFAEKSCASEHEIDSENRERIIKENVVSANAIPTTKILTISTFADFEWYQIYGKDSNVEIARIINTAEAIYHAQLGIRFRIVSQKIATNSTLEMDPSEILNAFRQENNANSSAALNHLFTGKDMTGRAVGIAYIGTFCWQPMWAYGVTQYYGGLTANIFAHEIGHNLGAQHDVVNYGSVMYPSVSFGDILFSQYSVNQINSHLTAFGSCLEYESETPTISIIKRKMQIIIRLQTASQLIGNEQVTYKVNSSKFVTKVTSNSGIISIKVKKRGKYKIVAYVTSDPSVTTKNALRF